MNEEIMIDKQDNISDEILGFFGKLYSRSSFNLI